jgi:hypothetical protein
MTAKDFLKQYEELDRKARRCKTEYDLEVERIDAIGSTLSGDGQPHGNGISRKTEDKAIRLAEKAARWKSAELDAIAKRQEVFEVINRISGVEADILYERYINLHKWEEICVLIHMSWTQTHEHHKRSLRIVQDMIDKSV